MICVTGMETNTRELAIRLARHPRSLHEVRLDALKKLDDELWRLLAGHPRLLLTCRGKAEGGRFRGTTAAQVSILERALTVGVDYVDVEASIGTEAVRQLFMHRGQTKLIVSAHEFATGTDPSPLWKKLSTLPADLHKLAFAVEDFADLEPLLDLQSSQTGRKILIGMGDAGVPSRMLYKRFGSAWTYVHDGDSVAPGQLDADTAERWALDRKQDAVPYGLLGGDSVFRSPGPRVYNTLFIQHALNAIYVPLKSSRVEAALRLAKRLGFGGLSVTMPAKREVLPYLSSQDDIAARAGAVNTIHFDGDELYGENSDAAALQQMVNGAEGTILLLGAGGVARALLAATDPERVVISARNTSSAKQLAEEFGTQVIPWSKRGSIPFDILVNATSLGTTGSASPLPPRVQLKGRTVVDAVMRTNGTPLTRKAARAGATVHDGFEMWQLQGSRQMTSLLGVEFTPEEMSEVLHD